jgi:hypothetical protein
VTVEFSGPLFDGTADAQLRKGADAAEVAIGEQVQDEVRLIVRSRARQRTGYYEQRVTLDRARGGVSVHDKRVRYGGWLEGTWPRNASSSFKGWDQFDRARQQVESQATSIAEHELGPYIDRMG